MDQRMMSDTQTTVQIDDIRHLLTGMDSSIKLLETNLERIGLNDREYYDAAQDQTDIQQYYNSVDLSTTDSKTLFRSLNELLTHTHENQPNYGSSGQHLKTWVDLHSDGTFRSIYSGKEADPVSVLKEDQEFLQQQDVTSEGGLPLNIEHVVPQSYFNKREPMRGDLHHLFYCEIGCNSYRGNKVYEDFPNFNPERIMTNDSTRDHCGMETGGDARTGGEFEPEYGKGFVARATLYFLMRHGDQIKPEFRSKFNVQVLLDWHKQFPPNLLYEKHRNQAIFRIQGNRNPFIDMPELASKIDFSTFSQFH
ncbi:endonuclease [Paenibacillus sp. FSL H7-0942]|uniref:endonuclease I family protein n=1 Tax=Paenibacillus sp. FSL H7-0942 TaxID=2921444 RepID=UPI00324B33B2